MSRQIYAVCLKCLFSLVLLVSIGLPALGQSASSAAVNGIVQDTTDARIPNASVKLINTDTGTESNSTTNKDGNFSIPSVLPGHYRLQIEREGFDTTQLTGITLNVGDNKNVIIRLKVGSPQQTVTVDGSGLTINTTDASVSTVIDRNFVANIPLNGRSFQDLILLTPGVVTQSPQSGSVLNQNGDFSVNGQRTEANYYTVDGVAALGNAGNGGGVPNASTSGSLSSSTALGTTQSLVSVDALQEFRVESSSYSAEYGRMPGGQFSFVTRSGTSKYHGTIFDYLRNNVFDANDWFNNYYGKAAAALRQNDFGGTFGGPIIIPKFYDGRERSFFFFSYEGLRLSQPQPATLQFVPSLALRQSAPALLQPILNAFPLPTLNGIDYGNGLAQFLQSYSTPDQIDSTSLRLDHTLNPREHIFVRASYTPSYSSTRDLSSFEATSSDMLTYTLGLTSALSHNITNELRFGYSRGDASLHYTLDTFGGAHPIDLVNAEGLSGQANPGADFELYFSGTGTSDITQWHLSSSSLQWNLTDSLSWLVGHHHFTVGVDYRDTKSPLRPYSPYGTLQYDSQASVLNNQADTSELLQRVGAVPIYHEFSLFAQDAWRFSPNLVLSLGLRWEVNPPPGAVGNDVPYVVLGNINEPSTLYLAPKGTPLWDTAWYNIAPRLGIAWTVRNSSDWETVLRGGGGIFFDTGNENATDGYGGIGYSASKISYSGTPAPFTQAQLDFAPSITPPFTSALGYSFPRNLQLPYTIQWNVAVEQALGANQTISVSYLGSAGRKLIEQNYIKPTATQDSEFYAVELYRNATTSNYQALQAEFQRRLRYGVQALASYTWSHSIDFGSTNLAYPYTRGNSDFDVRHNFTSRVSWDYPSISHGGASAIFLDGWGLDDRFTARTAFPVNPTGTEYIDPNTGQLATLN